jgi:hypothetical protein
LSACSLRSLLARSGLRPPLSALQHLSWSAFFLAEMLTS